MGEPSQKRQAGEVGITPEIIEAGVSALLEFYTDEIHDDPHRVAITVYRAMHYKEAGGPKSPGRKSGSKKGCEDQLPKDG